MRKLILLLSIACAGLLAADITGTWNFAVETSQGSGAPVFTFKQAGDKLTGTYEGMLGKAEVKGAVKGDKVEFEFEVAPDGNRLKIQYKGAIESATKMKGEADFGDFGKATWTATKK